jgi:cardiolipin synthase
MSARVLRLQNALTLVRVPLAALLWLRPHAPWFLVAVMAVAALSDLLDGALARALDPSVRTDPDNLGAWLDPLCDKIFVASLVALVVVHYTPPLGLALLTLMREALLLPLLLAWALAARPRGWRVDFRAVWAGKLTTVLQFLAVGAMLFAPAWLVWLAPLAAATGALSVALVVRRELARSGAVATQQQAEQRRGAEEPGAREQRR